MPMLRGAYARAGQDGQGLVEYALILCLVVVVIVLVIALMGNQVLNMYCNISGSLHN
jgi:Flp pilus assembly pilin Flp